MKKQVKRTKLAIISGALAVILILTGILCVVTFHNNAYFSPDYPFVDLSGVLSKTELSKEDYKLLFFQTGLGKIAVDELLKQENGAEKIKRHQQSFFYHNEIVCEQKALTTCMEYNVSSKGNYTFGFELAPVKAGYVLAMESSHSFGWRHGHAGIVLNDKAVLEAPIIGQPTAVYSINIWRYYPTFIMLKLKDTSDEDLEKIALDAKETLEGIVYSPLAGLFKKQQGKKPENVQCAYLVWYAFNNFNIDIDSDGGNIVTVRDIINSDKFEVVQIYGYNPEDFWIE